MLSSSVLVVVFFFFFQAEDGIRDLTVTGVQTCALPILPRLRAAFRQGMQGIADLPRPAGEAGERRHLAVGRDAPGGDAAHHRVDARVGEIGRASCRERGESGGGGGWVGEKEGGRGGEAE